MSFNAIIAKLGTLTAIIFTVLQCIGFLINTRIPMESILIGAAVIPIRLFYLHRMSDISKNMARYVLWFGWDLSLIVIPTLMFDYYTAGTYMNMNGVTFMYNVKDVSFCINIGTYTMILTFLASVWCKNEKTPNFDYFLKTSKTGFYAVIAGLVALNVAALVVVKIFGLGTLGERAVLLPYKLTAITNFFAYGIAPFIQIFILDAMCKRKINILVPIGIIMAISLLAAYVSLSKGALIKPVVVIMVYVIMTKRLSAGLVYFSLALCLIAFVMASFLAAYRDSKKTIYKETFTSAGMGYSAMQYFHRIFTDGHMFIKLNSIMGQEELFSTLKYYNYDVTAFHTYGIDQTPYHAMHSSGCVTLPGAYMFGYPFYTFIVIFISLFVLYIDYGFPRSKGMLASTMMRVFFAYYFGKYVLPMMLLEFSTKLYNGVYNSMLYLLLLILCFVFYLRFFCVKKRTE